MKPISVTLEQSKETKGTYRFDSPDPNAHITSIYMRKSAFGNEPIPNRIVLTVQQEETAAGRDLAGAPLPSISCDEDCFPRAWHDPIRLTAISGCPSA